MIEIYSKVQFRKVCSFQNHGKMSTLLNLGISSLTQILSTGVFSVGWGTDLNHSHRESVPHKRKHCSLHQNRMKGTRFLLYLNPR